MKIDIIKPKRVVRKINKQKYYNLLFVLPLFLFLGLFLLVPFMTGFIKSFYRYDAITINEFIGFKNYITIFTKDEKFLISINNLCILMIAMPICLSTSIIAARLSLNTGSVRKCYFFRTVFCIPMALPAVVTMLMWKFMYYPEIGVFSNIFKMFGVEFPNVLGLEKTVIYAIIFMGFPWISGFNYIVMLAAFQGINNSLLEAATIDGASGWQRFFKIEMPIVAPQIKILLTLSVIGQIQDYERFLVITGGGPNNASLVPGLHMYQLSFASSGESQYGYACAISVILFVVTLILSLLIMKRRGDEK